MLNKTVVESDPFFEMPADSQALYMHLVLNADDEGFVGNPETIRRMTGFSKDSLKLLIAKGFLISFQSRRSSCNSLGNAKQDTAK